MVMNLYKLTNRIKRLTWSHSITDPEGAQTLTAEQNKTRKIQNMFSLI
jgi:hypothetical protein